MHTSTLLLPLLPLASAWGPLGHRTVAYLSTFSYTPATHMFVSTIFANDDGKDISDQAVWPDLIRKERPETMQWHFIDAQDDPPYKCAINYTRDCNMDGVAGCIVSALKNMTHILLDPTSSPALLKEALTFTVHMLGDIHQPMHTEHLAVGGNLIPVCFDKKCGRENKANLHAVWDAHIPAKMRGTPAYGLEELEEKMHALKWADELWNKTQELYQGMEGGIEGVKGECFNVTTPEDCALKWAGGANEYVCSYALKNGEKWLRNNDLGGEYYKGAVAIVEGQVTNAGIRLGSWLNAIVKERLQRLEAAQRNDGGFVVQSGKGWSFKKRMKRFGMSRRYKLLDHLLM